MKIIIIQFDFFFLFREEIKFQIEQNAMTAPTNDEHGLE